MSLKAQLEVCRREYEANAELKVVDAARRSRMRNRRALLDCLTVPQYFRAAYLALGYPNSA
jgi:hypothetical protein